MAPPDEMAIEAKEAVADGFGCVKVKVGRPGGDDIDAVDRRNPVTFDDSGGLGRSFRRDRFDEHPQSVAPGSGGTELEAQCRALCHHRIQTIDKLFAERVAGR